jgi:polyhydroxybutyrate depolymerase
MNLSHWNRLSDEEGFIVVYPSGTPQLLDVVRIWHTFELGTGLDRDVRYIAELIDALEAAYNIDSARVYVNGLSNGGGMAFVLSCALSDRIAAVGMVAPAQSLPSNWCRTNRPVPMIAFHGTSDPIVPYEGGPLGDPFNPVKPVFPAQRTFVASWAERNRCAAIPVESTIAPDVTRLEYGDCADGASVVLNTVIGGGHTWPGGKPLPKWYLGSTSNSIDATRQMWAFFRKHPIQANMMTTPLSARTSLES